MESWRFDEWVAFRSLEPIWEERIIAVLKLGLATLANAWGAKISPDDLDPVARREEEAAISPEKAAAIVAARWGPSYGK